MIKKIICPTDFSATSRNAIEYAAKLAQRMNATLTLLHVQPMYIGEGVSLFSGGERESVSEAKVAEKILDDICTDVNKLFKVSCTHDIITELGSFEKVVEDESQKFDLTVIGTNGADNVFQFYFGSHSFRIANKTSTPVLIIPEEFAYREIKNLVFVSDYSIGNNLHLEQLKQFTDIFNPQMNVIHISGKDNHISTGDFNVFCSMTQGALNYKSDIIFERMLHENETDAIKNFVTRTGADLLAIYGEEHGFVYRMFHTNLAKKLTFDAAYPILVFHK